MLKKIYEHIPAFFVSILVAAAVFFASTWLVKTFNSPEFVPWATSISLWFLILYNIAIRTNKISGELQILDVGNVLVRFNLYSGKNFTKIKRQHLEDNPHLGIKKMVVRNIDEYSYFYNEDYGRAVIVKFVNSDGMQQELALYHQQPQFYSAENLLQMV